MILIWWDPFLTSSLWGHSSHSCAAPLSLVELKERKMHWFTSPWSLCPCFLSVSPSIFLESPPLFLLVYFLSGLHLALKNHDLATFEHWLKVFFNLRFSLSHFYGILTYLSPIRYNRMLYPYRYLPTSSTNEPLFLKVLCCLIFHRISHFIVFPLSAPLHTLLRRIMNNHIFVLTLPWAWIL